MLRGLERFAERSSFTLIDKNAYLVTLALVSPTRNRGSRAQTPIFTIENQHFLVQMAPQASWPPDVPADSLEARSPQPRGIHSQEPAAKTATLSQLSSGRTLQPGVLGQDSSAGNPGQAQPGVLSQESSTRNPSPRSFSQESSARTP